MAEENTEAVDAESEVIDVEESDDQGTAGHEEEAKKIVRKFMLLSSGVGLIPVPVVDIIGLAALQLRLLYRLVKLYEIPFDKQRAKVLIGALVGTGTPGVATKGFSSLLKAIPGVGSVVGFFSMSLLGGASTYAIGKVFTYHFELGGTLLDFDPESTKEYFTQAMAEGNQEAGRVSMAGAKP